MLFSCLLKPLCFNCKQDARHDTAPGLTCRVRKAVPL